MSLETYFDDQYFRYLDEGYTDKEASRMAIADCRSEYEECQEIRRCCPNGACRGLC